MKKAAKPVEEKIFFSWFTIKKNKFSGLVTAHLMSDKTYI